VTGLRARGGLTVDMEWKNGAISEATVRATRAGEVQITTHGSAAAQTVKLRAGVPNVLHF